MANNLHDSVANCANYLLANADKYLNDLVFINIGNSKMSEEFFTDLSEQIKKYQRLSKSNQSNKEINLHVCQNGIDDPKTQLNIRQYKTVVFIVEEYKVKKEQLEAANKMIINLASNVLGVLYVD